MLLQNMYEFPTYTLVSVPRLSCYDALNFASWTQIKPRNELPQGQRCVVISIRVCLPISLSALTPPVDRARTNAQTKRPYLEWDLWRRTWTQGPMGNDDCNKWSAAGGAAFCRPNVFTPNGGLHLRYCPSNFNSTFPYDICSLWVLPAFQYVLTKKQNVIFDFWLKLQVCYDKSITFRGVPY